MAVTYIKFDQFLQDLNRGKHNFASDSIHAILSNTAPVPGSQTVYADLTELANGGGYTTGGGVLTVGESRSGGTEKITVLADYTWTGSGVGFGPFQYLILVNWTPTVPLKPIICAWNLGQAINVGAGDSWIADFDQAAGIFTMT